MKPRVEASIKITRLESSWWKVFSTSWLMFSKGLINSKTLQLSLSVCSNWLSKSQIDRKSSLADLCIQKGEERGCQLWSFPLFTYHLLPQPPLNSDRKIWFCHLTKLHRLPRFLPGWDSGEQWLPRCCWSSTVAVCQGLRGESGQSAWLFGVLTGLTTHSPFKDRRNQETLIPEDIMSSTQGQSTRIVYSCSCWSYVLKGFEV